MIVSPWGFPTVRNDFGLPLFPHENGSAKCGGRFTQWARVTDSPEINLSCTLEAVLCGNVECGNCRFIMFDYKLCLSAH